MTDRMSDARFKEIEEHVWHRDQLMTFEETKMLMELGMEAARARKFEALVIEEIPRLRELLMKCRETFEKLAEVGSLPKILRETMLVARDAISEELGT